MTYIQTTNGGAALARAGAAMHLGKKRTRQEDCADITDRYVVVADGMGGQKDGDRASASAVRAVTMYLDSFQGEDTPQALIESAFESAQTVVGSLAAGSSIWTAPATTLILGLRHPDGMTIGHLGDSRAYAFVGGLLVQLTSDHENPDGSINGYVGTGNWRMPDIIPVSGEDARIIFATDGLFGMLTDEQITEICAGAEDASPVALASLLTDAAVEAGGLDNVTVVVVDL